ncbi:MAG: hypothetical protein IT285_02140 [Bdellovibrionales bacterium]|nr:hypothetical protein [Bdellovibrionales bacterium]
MRNFLRPFLTLGLALILSAGAGCGGARTRPDPAELSPSPEERAAEESAPNAAAESGGDPAALEEEAVAEEAEAAEPTEAVAEEADAEAEPETEAETAAEPAAETVTAPAAEAAPVGPPDWNFLAEMGRPAQSERHVLLVQLGAVRPDLFRLLLTRGHLPHFRLLLARGRWSGDAAVSHLGTGEPAERLLESLTGRRASQWGPNASFDRSELGFTGPLLDPREEIARAVALSEPTVADLVMARGGRVAGAIPGYHRTLGPAEAAKRVLNSGSERNPGPPERATADAGAVVDTVLLELRSAVEGGSAPALTVVSLDALGRWADARGVSHGRRPKGSDRGGVDRKRNYCLRRNAPEARSADPWEPLFRKAAELQARGEPLPQFTRIRPGAQELCVRLPTLNLYSLPSRETRTDTLGAMSGLPADAASVLSLVNADLELGRLIQGLRQARFGENGAIQWSEEAAGAITAYGTRRALERSLFESTLFVIVGDHGVAETRSRLTPTETRAETAARADRVFGRTLAEDLARELRLELAPQRGRTRENAQVLVTLERAPEELAQPGRRALRAKAERLAAAPSLPAPDLALRRGYFDQHVRAVAAPQSAPGRAELFLPSEAMGSPSWETRPSLDEILAYDPTPDDGGSDLISSLRESPAVGLIFARKGNELIVPGAPPPNPMEILVIDRFDNRGMITVSLDESTGERVFRYARDPESEKDPLGYGGLGEPPGTFGTWREWNEASVRRRHYYHNVTALVGTHLHTSSPRVGDLLILHAQGWGFGAGVTSHGGLHREEALAPLIVSGPAVEPGMLRSRSRLRTKGNGRLGSSDRVGAPVAADAAGLLTEYLGLGAQALENFRNDSGPEGFGAWRERWIRELAMALPGGAPVTTASASPDETGPRSPWEAPLAPAESRAAASETGTLLLED